MQDGVIKFNLDFQQRVLELPVARIAGLLSWREILFRLQLVGMNESRYQGFGFGNVSQRLEDGSFLISGTQTGGIHVTALKHYARVREWNLKSNQVFAEGEVKPSSESLTHAAIYELDSEVRFVFHAHSPSIWSRAAELNIAMSDEDIAYGTIEMANEVKRLQGEGRLANRALAMGGHEDGVITFGYTAEEAGGRLVQYLALARVAELVTAEKQK